MKVTVTPDVLREGARLHTAWGVVRRVEGKRGEVTGKIGAHLFRLVTDAVAEHTGRTYDPSRDRDLFENVMEQVKEAAHNG